MGNLDPLVSFIITVIVVANNLKGGRGKPLLSVPII